MTENRGEVLESNKRARRRAAEMTIARSWMRISSLPSIATLALLSAALLHSGHRMTTLEQALLLSLVVLSADHVFCALRPRRLWSLLTPALILFYVSLFFLTLKNAEAPSLGMIIWPVFALALALVWGTCLRRSSDMSWL